MDLRSLKKTISENLVYDLLKYAAIATGSIVIAASTYVLHKWLPTHDLIAACIVLAIAICAFAWLTRQMAKGRATTTKGGLRVEAHGEVVNPLPALTTRRSGSARRISNRKKIHFCEITSLLFRWGIPVNTWRAKSAENPLSRLSALSDCKLKKRASVCPYFERGRTIGSPFHTYIPFRRGRSAKDGRDPSLCVRQDVPSAA